MMEENYCIPFIENIKKTYFKISFEVEKNIYSAFNFIDFIK